MDHGEIDDPVSQTHFAIVQYNRNCSLTKQIINSKMAGYKGFIIVANE